MSSLDDVLGALSAAQMALGNTIARLEIRALASDCTEEERRQIELQVQRIKLDKQGLGSRFDALTADRKSFTPPSAEILQGLKTATEQLAKQVVPGATTSLLIELAIQLANAARAVKTSPS